MIAPDPDRLRAAARRGDRTAAAALLRTAERSGDRTAILDALPALEPSAAAFRDVLVALEIASGRGGDVAPHLAQIAGWPATLKTVPPRWLRRAEPPALAATAERLRLKWGPSTKRERLGKLIDAVRPSEVELSIDRAGIEPWLVRRDLGRVRRLRIDGTSHYQCQLEFAPILARMPALRVLDARRVVDAQHVLAAIAQVPTALEEVAIDAIWWARPREDSIAGTLAAATHLASVRALSLVGARLPDALPELLDGPLGVGLEALTLGFGYPGRPLEAEIPDTVRVLELRTTPISPAWLRRVAARGVPLEHFAARGQSGAPHAWLAPKLFVESFARARFAVLDRLALERHAVGKHAFRALVEIPCLGALRHLSLHGVQLAPDAASLAALLERCASLRSLDLGGVLEGDIAAALAALPLGVGLEALDLSAASLDPEDVAWWSHGPTLRRLVLDRATLDDLDVADILSQLGDGPLAELSLRGLPLGPATWRALLARVGSHGRLARLDVRETPLGREQSRRALRALAVEVPGS